MYERCINEAELILSTQKDSIAPVRKIWEEVERRAKEEGFAIASLSDFSTMLEGDRRFLIIPAQIKNLEDQETQTETELEDAEMERLGFFSEDQVKLRTTRIIERPVSDDEEEIGSIRRRAFAGHTTEKKAAAAKKSKSYTSEKSSKLSAKKKKSAKKSNAAKKTKPAQNRKSKLRKRIKK